MDILLDKCLGDYEYTYVLTNAHIKTHQRYQAYISIFRTRVSTYDPAVVIELTLTS